MLRSERAALGERETSRRRTALAVSPGARRSSPPPAAGNAARTWRAPPRCSPPSAGCAPASDRRRGDAMRSSDPLPLRLQVREVRALAAGRDGEPRRALAEVRRGLGELGAFQRSLGSLDLRTAGAVHGVALAQIGLDVTLAPGRPGDVLAMVEQSRAISTRLPQLRPPDDERTAALLGELRALEEEARGLEGDPDAAAEVARLREPGRRPPARHPGPCLGARGRRGRRRGRRTPALPRPGCGPRHRVGLRQLARHRGRWLAVVVRPGRGDPAPAGADSRGDRGSYAGCGPTSMRWPRPTCRAHRRRRAQQSARRAGPARRPAARPAGRRRVSP